MSDIDRHYSSGLPLEDCMTPDDWDSFLATSATKAEELFNKSRQTRIGKRKPSTKPYVRTQKARPYPKFKKQAHRARK